jgi:hypothetical protein
MGSAQDESTLDTRVVVDQVFAALTEQGLVVAKRSEVDRLVAAGDALAADRADATAGAWHAARNGLEFFGTKAPHSPEDEPAAVG